MAEEPQSTIYELPSRPQNQASASNRPLISEVPRGSVSEKINFFEKMKVRAPEKPSEQIFRFNKLNQVVELDTPIAVPIPERLTGPSMATYHQKTISSDFEDMEMPPDEQGEALSVQAPKQSFSVPHSCRHYMKNLPSVSEVSLKGDDHSESTRDSQQVYRGVVSENELDAICVNCLEYVGLRDIDDHSYLCSKVVYDPPTLQEEIALKVKKMHRGINRRMKTARGEKLMVLVRLREVAVEITKNEQADLPRLAMELQEMAVNSLSVEGGIPCSIFCRRLSNLVSEKEALRVADEPAGEDVLNVEAEKRRKELIKWKAQSLALGHMTSALRGLQDIQSEVGTDRVSSASGTERLSGGSLGNEDSDVADLQAADEALQQVSEEQLKKYFYSMCLKQKLMLPKQHPKQRMLVSTLYEEVKSRGVPVSQWEKFIIDCLLIE